MMTEMDSMRLSARVAGLTPEEAEPQIAAKMAAQRERFEVAFEPNPEDRARLSQWWNPQTQEYNNHPAYYLNGAWHGWKLRERLSGMDPFLGFMFEAANEGEQAAYDFGCRSAEIAVRDVLSGRDDGAGTTMEPWASLRKKLLEMKAKADRLDALEAQE